MSRCERTWDLEVHHKRVDGGNGLNNAMVLCRTCHKNTSSWCDPNHRSPEPFSDSIKKQALERAGNRCECEKGTCCL